MICLTLRLYIVVAFLLAHRVTQIFDVLIIFEKKFCLMYSLKFTFSDVTSFLLENLSGLKNQLVAIFQFRILSSFVLEIIFVA